MLPKSKLTALSLGQMSIPSEKDVSLPCGIVIRDLANVLIG